MRYLEPAHEQVNQRGIEIDLNDDGHGDQEDRQPAAGQVLRLEREDQDQGEEQGADHHGMELREEVLFEPLESVRPEQQGAREPASGEGYDDEYYHRSDQYFGGHDDVGNAAEEHHDRRESHEHDEIVHRDLDQRVGWVAVREVGPDKHHGGARGRREDDQPGRVVSGGFGID